MADLFKISGTGQNMNQTWRNTHTFVLCTRFPTFQTHTVVRMCYATQQQRNSFVRSAIQPWSYLFCANYSAGIMFSADWDVNICAPLYVFLYSPNYCVTSRICFFPGKWHGCRVWKAYSYDSPWSLVCVCVCVCVQTHRHTNPQVSTQWHIHWCNHTHRKPAFNCFIAGHLFVFLFCIFYFCHLISMHDYILNSYFRLFHISGPYLICILLCSPIFRLISLYLYVFWANINKLIT